MQTFTVAIQEFIFVQRLFQVLKLQIVPFLTSVAQLGRNGELILMRLLPYPIAPMISDPVSQIM
jgi:hypothetical protein